MLAVDQHSELSSPLSTSPHHTSHHFCLLESTAGRKQNHTYPVTATYRTQKPLLQPKMAPRRTSTRSKQGLAQVRPTVVLDHRPCVTCAYAHSQPTLSFQTRKPGTTGKKPSLSSVKSVSASSIPRESSTEDTAAASRPASPTTTEIRVVERPAPHAAAETAQRELDEGKKRKRPELNVKDKAWEGVKRQAMKEMGGLQPSESSAPLFSSSSLLETPARPRSRL